MEKYKQLCEITYLNERSIFYKANFDFKNDLFIKTLESYSNQETDQIKVPKPQEIEKQKINNVLVIYLILLVEVTRTNCFMELLTKFVFLFREYLNMMGWEHIKYLNQYGLVQGCNLSGEFCEENTCEEVPELVNDFTTIFIELDYEFSLYAKDIKDITQNFCYWLYINELTNFKLVKKLN